MVRNTAQTKNLTHLGALVNHRDMVKIIVHQLENLRARGQPISKKVARQVDLLGHYTIPNSKGIEGDLL